MQLTLTTDEQRFLLSLLERQDRELQKEISHTDHHEFKVVCAEMKLCSTPS